MEIGLSSSVSPDPLSQYKRFFFFRVDSSYFDAIVSTLKKKSFVL
jgi:hypothetical protein